MRNEMLDHKPALMHKAILCGIHINSGVVVVGINSGDLLMLMHKTIQGGIRGPMDHTTSSCFLVLTHNPIQVGIRGVVMLNKMRELASKTRMATTNRASVEET